MSSMLDKPISNEIRLNLITVAWHNLRNNAIRLIRFFTLTEEERSKAGIYTGGEGRIR